jgi:hypothetical protein
MLKRTTSWLGLLLAAWLWAPPATANDSLPPASQWLPGNAVLVAQIAKPGDLLDLLLSPRAVEAITALPVYQKAVSQPKFQELLTGIQFIEAQLGTDWKTAVRKLTGGGLTWAVGADGGQLLVIDAQDAELLGRLHEIILQIAKSEAAKQGQEERVKSTEQGGVTCWSFTEGEGHAIVGRRFVLSNRPAMLKAVLDRKGNPSGGLDAQPAFQAAKRVGADAAASVYLNAGVLKANPAIRKALDSNQNAMGALLFAPVLDVVRRATWLAGGLRIDAGRLVLRLTADGKGEAASEQAAFAAPKPGDGALENLAVPRRIAAASLYRDLHAFYGAKDKLFSERTSGLIFFENMMGIFFSGRDLTDDILAQPKPDVRIVVAQQQYDPAIGTPQMQLPAFATVFRVRDPKGYADTIESAWQKAIGLVSITSGQKAEAGLVIDRDSYHDVRYTVAHFARSKEAGQGPLGAQFNFRPSLVRLGEYVVISSTDGLAKDLIDAIQQEQSHPPQPLAGVHSLMEFDAGQLSSILEANRETLVRHNMVEKGNSKTQAETEVGLYTAVSKQLGQARLNLGGGPAGPEATLEVKLNLH